MKKLPLHKFHKKHKAHFISLGEWQVPGSYGDEAAEYKSLVDSVCLVDRSYIGKVLLKGDDALDLLNRITTNDLTDLMLGYACDTIFSTPKGRIVDYCRVLGMEDGIIIFSSHHDTTHLIEWINRFIILEDVETEDVSEDYVWISLVGYSSKMMLEKVCFTSEVGRDDQIWIKLGNESIPVFSNNDYNVPVFDICLPKSTSDRIMDEFYHLLHQSGGCLAGQIPYQVLRTESGLPAWGSEITENFNPHEARLVNAVSFTKGCYTGQEVIARLDTYDKVQKYLMVIKPDGQLQANPPLDIYLEDEKIGVLTSLINNPHSGKTVGLGYISKQYAVEDFQIQAEISDGDNRILSTLHIPPKNLT